MIFCSKLLFFLRFCCFLILKPYKTKAFTASQAPNSAELELSDIRADIRIFPCSLQDCLKKSCLSCPLLLLSSPPLPLLLSNTSHLFRGRGMKAGRKEPKKEERKESKQMKEETFYSLSLSLPFLSFLLCLQAEREREGGRQREGARERERTEGLLLLFALSFFLSVSLSFSTIEVERGRGGERERGEGKQSKAKRRRKRRRIRKSLPGSGSSLLPLPDCFLSKTIRKSLPGATDPPSFLCQFVSHQEVSLGSSGSSLSLSLLVFL